MNVLLKHIMLAFFKHGNVLKVGKPTSIITDHKIQTLHLGTHNALGSLSADDNYPLKKVFYCLTRYDIHPKMERDSSHRIEDVPTHRHG